MKDIQKKDKAIFKNDLAAILITNGFNLKYIRKNRNAQHLNVFYFEDSVELQHYLDLFKNDLISIETKYLDIEQEKIAV